MINIGIDLGTTNSSIARFRQGRVEVFKNPVTLKETLPSVVAFRQGRVVIGDKAREFLRTDPENVVGGFKRKMGTTETYPIPQLKTDKSPVDLSALLLRELKTFVHSGERVNAAVITIPASFDTVQSNATRRAGEAAGLEQVVLLQEPIAASLAYANQGESGLQEEGQWLVYDLGGGTFDVALLRIKEGEMKVLDHEGDNFLGGNDFDKEMVERLIVPHLQQQGKFDNLLRELKSASGKYNQLYYKLLYLAEEAKIQLSHADSTEIEFEVSDDEGRELFVEQTLTRIQFESLMQPFIDRTLHMARAILDRNKLAAKDLRYVLMVGGSTYIPFVRTQVGQQLGVEVNTDIDPTTAVAVGAAFYAGTQQRISALPTENPDGLASDLSVQMAYQKATQDDEEYFAARFTGAYGALVYRIVRLDGGFDSGLKPLKAQIHEYLPLVKDSYNTFELKVFDALGNAVELTPFEIGIAQGRYAVAGQPLPHDICLEVDDLDRGSTALELIFQKNALLPLRKTFTKTVTRSIAKGSDEEVTIHVLEGPSSALPAANQPIGFISVSGKQLSRDLIKGSDIEITLELSESRDLRINAYLMLTDQEFEDVFTPSERHVSVHRLRQDIALLSYQLDKEIEEAQELEHFESARKLLDVQQELLELGDQLGKLAEDDVTDEKFQIEDRKRKMAQRIDELTRDKHIIKVKMEYFETKRDIEYVLTHYAPTDAEREELSRTLEKEKEYLASNSLLRIQEVVDQFRNLSWRIRSRSPEYLKAVFYWLVTRQDEFSDPDRGDELVFQGEEAIHEEKWDMLRLVINQISGLLPASVKDQVIRGGTGIG